MLAVLLGLISAFFVGTSDFLGGAATKRMSPVKVIAIVSATGLVALTIANIFIDGHWSVDAVVWGGLSGLVGGIAGVLLYVCLAIGPMSVLSPLTALVAAIVPMSIGLADGAHLRPIHYVALAIALIAVLLVGFAPTRDVVRPTPRAITLALAAGIAVGLFLVLLKLTPADSGLTPLIANRAANGSMMFLIIGIAALLARKHRRSGASGSASPAAAGTGLSLTGLMRLVSAPTSLAPPSPTIESPSPRSRWASPGLLATVSGLVLAISNAGLLTSLRLGDLAVISVIGAMYPIGTITLAAIVLRERIAPLQGVGLVLALGAAGMLALG